VLCAAVHAGWRGTAAGIAANAVCELLRLGAKPENLRAAIGPCIGKCCYRVREDFADAVRSSRGAAFSDEFVVPDTENPGFFRADLAGMNVKILTDAGISRENIDVGGLCTCCDPEKFYSTARGEKRGTHLALISL
jgi:YfiH family protein